MSLAAALVADLDPRTDSQQSERDQLRQIDGSLRSPVALLALAAGLWLLAASLLGLITAFKLVNPEFLWGSECMTFGRVSAAAGAAAIYGWGCNAAFAVGLWIMARLCATAVRHMGILYVAIVFWNLAVLWGTGGILHQGPTGVPFLQMTPGVLPLMMFSYVLIAAWGVRCFYHRAAREVFVAQWYLLAGACWFAWLFATAALMIFWSPARGVLQAVAGTWYAYGVVGVWFAPVALGTIYYLLPKLLGRAIPNYYLAVVGFWNYGALALIAGFSHLTYAPVPVWVQTCGIVASILLIAPVLIISLNHLPLLWRHTAEIWSNPCLRFLAFAAAGFALWGVIGSWMAARHVAVYAQLTLFMQGYALNGIYAFFSMAMFGALYFLLPRVLGRELPKPGFVAAHFACAALGTLVLLGALYFGGWEQGRLLNEPYIPFAEVVASVSNIPPWLVVGGALLALGHLLFAANVLLILWPVSPKGGAR